MSVYVYILCSERNSQYYIGQTSDLFERINRHNSGYVPATRNALPWKMIWACEKNNRSEAMTLERKLKNLNRSRLGI
ncbi:MAG: GIY-YIG nuclease family protein [Flavobacteriales bacterium]|nr:GIY-YIG nuclease family protein [Flavobacteriales bacterium]